MIKERVDNAISFAIKECFGGHTDLNIEMIKRICPDAAAVINRLAYVSEERRDMVCSLQHQVGELKSSVYLLERSLGAKLSSEYVPPRSSLSGDAMTKETDMSFLEAMNALERGHTVKRKNGSWKHKIDESGCIVMWHDEDDINKHVNFPCADVYANDWDIVKPSIDTVEKRNWAEEKLKIVDEIHTDVTQYIAYREDFENECAATDRMIEGICKKAEQLKQLQDEHVAAL